MEATRSKESHIERTASDPRDSQIHSVTLDQIGQINDNTRLFRLGISDESSIKFLPGQWLDTFVPNIPKPGGFTITSPPSKASLPTAPYLELAVQRSTNPPAAWLWEKASIGTLIKVRVGGAFVWPPPDVDLSSVRRIVFVAGGVGINPLMSILSHLSEKNYPYDIHFLYSVKAPGDLDSEKILFVERLATIYGRGKVSGRLQLFLTGLNKPADRKVLSCNEMDVGFRPQRITLEDISAALGPKEDHGSAIVGLDLGSDRVLCEKWW
ncbi:Oxidoreductase NAD-binding domain-containing protein 1 [Colletotrichum tropicale]|nr:Oxidoreductase NAD-binding domain-containing protein 1 [Colletotrichum tropicale]